LASERVSRLRRRARSIAAAPAGLLGYELVRRNYYSPIPDLRHLTSEVFDRRSELPGVNFDPAGGLAFVENELSTFVAEFRPPVEQTPDPRCYYLENTLYGPVDAAVLYAMVRRFTPAQVLELGSGFSTLVIADARARNGHPDKAGHVVCDPYPRPELAPVLDEIADLRAVSASEVPDEQFAKLRPGDLLFIDTTHTVKIGSEVNRLILEVLPRIAPGVLIHIHDIYLPWEYPRSFLMEQRFFWTEQYLLHAFLAFNREFEVILGAHLLVHDYPGELSKLIPTVTTATPASAFWIRRTFARS
jgi:hypothetical protein